MGKGGEGKKKQFAGFSSFLSLFADEGETQGEKSALLLLKRGDRGIFFLRAEGRTLAEEITISDVSAQPLRRRGERERYAFLASAPRERIGPKERKKKRGAKLTNAPSRFPMCGRGAAEGKNLG